MNSTQSTATVVFAICLLAACQISAQEAQPAQSGAPQSNTGTQRISKVGAIKSIDGHNLVLKTDSGQDVNVTLQPDARLVRLRPGQTDLKSAEAITVSQVQVGDRMLVRGQPGENPDSVVAFTAVLMKQSDVAEKQQKDVQDWQRRGTGGIVSAIDKSTGVVTVSVTPTLSVAVKTSKDTNFLRYAANSIKFADAQKGTFDDIKTGDQLRARGTRSADGKEIAAEDVISGTFRNIAGTISGIDPAANTIIIKDILAKKTVAVKLTNESQMRKLPAQLAQRIAFFLRSPGGAQPASAQGGGSAGGSGGSRGAGGSGMAQGGPGGGRGGNGADFQQLINRLPAIGIADLQKEEAVMIVSTPGTGGSDVTAITLLSGVEPILTSPNASGAAALLNGWNLSGPPGEGGAQ